MCSSDLEGGFLGRGGISGDVCVCLCPAVEGGLVVVIAPPDGADAIVPSPPDQHGHERDELLGLQPDSGAAGLDCVYMLECVAASACLHVCGCVYFCAILSHV